MFKVIKPFSLANTRYRVGDPIDASDFSTEDHFNNMIELGYISKETDVASPVIAAPVTDAPVTDAHVPAGPEPDEHA